jgi:hypothetical protein
MAFSFVRIRSHRDFRLSALGRASAKVLTAPNRRFRSAPINGHHPTDLDDPFRAKGGSDAARDHLIGAAGRW